MSAVHVFVSGVVQGVGYRFATVRQATHLGLKGWVRNLADGRVEAVFEGDRAAIQQMLQWCHRGPSAAIVDDVVVTEVELTGSDSFEVKYR